MKKSLILQFLFSITILFGCSKDESYFENQQNVEKTLAERNFWH